jgi:hypothetical protein
MSFQTKSWFQVKAAPEVSAAPPHESRDPSLLEVLLMSGTTLAVHFLTASRVRFPWEPPDMWFDRKQYLETATIVRHWHFSGGPLPKVFWGFPYAIAGISKLFSIPESMAVVLISMVGSLLVCILLHRLYGGWVAAVFVFVDYHWIALSVEGGTEPLFMCLLFASFLAARSSRWEIAALLASLSTTVRPLAVLALVSFAAVLAVRKSYRKLVTIALIGLGTGVLYVVPLWIVLGNPFANFVGYRGDWGPRGWPLTYPFGAMGPSYYAAFHEMRWTVFVFSAVWVIVLLVGMAAMCLPSNRQRLWTYQPEALFAWMYTLFFIVFNNVDMAVSFARYILPVLPLLLFAMRDWIPRDRRLLWGGALLSALLASATTVGFKNVFGFSLP